MSFARNANKLVFHSPSDSLLPSIPISLLSGSSSPSVFVDTRPLHGMDLLPNRLPNLLLQVRSLTESLLSSFSSFSSFCRLFLLDSSPNHPLFIFYSSSVQAPLFLCSSSIHLPHSSSVHLQYILCTSSIHPVFCV
jgi:hypothetical protein